MDDALLSGYNFNPVNRSGKLKRSELKKNRSELKDRSD